MKYIPIALIVSFLSAAVWQATRPREPKITFHFHRAEAKR